MTLPATRIAVLSDSHGYPDDWVFAALRGTSHIIHAGDVQSDELIIDLKRIAPVTWVVGNMDGYDTHRRSAAVTIENFTFYVIHEIERLDLDPFAAGVHAVIHGHTHRPDIRWKQNVLYLNPGSVSRPRSGPVPSLAIISIENNTLHPQIIYRM